MRVVFQKLNASSRLTMFTNYVSGLAYYWSEGRLPENPNSEIIISEIPIKSDNKPGFISTYGRPLPHPKMITWA
jgi:hypothetical protein